MKTIIQSEKVSVYQIKENHAVVVNSLDTPVAIIHRSDKEIIWQHGIQDKDEVFFTAVLMHALADTPWEIRPTEWNQWQINKYADIEVNPLIKNYSSNNQKDNITDL